MHLIIDYIISSLIHRLLKIAGETRLFKFATMTILNIPPKCWNRIEGEKTHPISTVFNFVYVNGVYSIKNEISVQSGPYLWVTLLRTNKH